MPSSASGASQTNGAVQKNSAKPCKIGRASHSTTSTITAMATRAGLIRLRRPIGVTLRLRASRAVQHCGNASGETNDSLRLSVTRSRTALGSTLFVMKRVPENDSVPT